MGLIGMLTLQYQNQQLYLDENGVMYLSDPEPDSSFLVFDAGNNSFVLADADNGTCLFLNPALVAGDPLSSTLAQNLQDVTAFSMPSGGLLASGELSLVTTDGRGVGLGSDGAFVITSVDAASQFTYSLLAGPLAFEFPVGVDGNAFAGKVLLQCQALYLENGASGYIALQGSSLLKGPDTTLPAGAYLCRSSIAPDPLALYGTPSLDSSTPVGTYYMKTLEGGPLGLVNGPVNSGGLIGIDISWGQFSFTSPRSITVMGGGEVQACFLTCNDSDNLGFEYSDYVSSIPVLHPYPSAQDYFFTTVITPGLATIQANGQCRNGDFSNLNLTNANFKNIDLTGANFQNTILAGADFTNANLTNADLTGAWLQRAKLVNANLAGTNFTNTDLTQTVFDPNPQFSPDSTSYTIFRGATVHAWSLGANWSGVDLTGATLVGGRVGMAGLVAEHAILTGVTIFQGQQLYASFAGSTLDQTDFTDCIFAQVNFANCDLTTALFDASAKLASPTGAVNVLSGAKFNVSLIGTNWTSLDLTNATIVGLDQTIDLSNLQGQNAILVGLNLSGKNLTGAQLQNAHLTAANLTGANLSQANLSGAQLGAQSTTQPGANLTSAYLESTVLDTAYLYGVIFANGTLIQVSLLNTTSMEQTIFTDAYLEDVNFGGGALTGSAPNLSGANFIGACLINCNFNGAIMTTPASTAVATQLENAFLQGAIFTGAQLNAVNLQGAVVSFAAGSILTQFYDGSRQLSGLFPTQFNATVGLDTTTLGSATICPNGLTLAQNQTADNTLTQMLTAPGAAPSQWSPPTVQRLPPDRV